MAPGFQLPESPGKKPRKAIQRADGIHADVQVPQPPWLPSIILLWDSGPAMSLSFSTALEALGSR